MTRSGHPHRQVRQRGGATLAARRRGGGAARWVAEVEEGEVREMARRPQARVRRAPGGTTREHGGKASRPAASRRRRRRARRRRSAGCPFACDCSQKSTLPSPCLCRCVPAVATRMMRLVVTVVVVGVGLRLVAVGVGLRLVAAAQGASCRASSAARLGWLCIELSASAGPPGLDFRGEGLGVRG